MRHLLREVGAAERRGEVVFKRSTLLLVVGISMAFIGVVTFYFTITEPKQGQDFWQAALRPTGMLIFIEAIAWFLLRQYRALIEDYKWFYRIYLKRTNYVGALMILDRTPVRTEDLLVASALIQEDLSGLLQKDQTTELLERSKLTDESPITEFFRVAATFNKAKEKAAAPADDKKSEKS